jgi:hypothetical protein
MNDIIRKILVLFAVQRLAFLSFWWAFQTKPQDSIGKERQISRTFSLDDPRPV